MEKKRSSFEFKKDLQNINELIKQTYQTKQDILHEGKQKRTSGEFKQILQEIYTTEKYNHQTKQDIL